VAELKTRPTTRSVAAFIAAMPDSERRRDCRAVLRIMKEATRAQPKMWGTSIVGFGSFRYRGASRREVDWFLTGFSPRKQSLTLYIMSGFAGAGALLRRLGRHTTGVSCLYLKRLDDVDLAVLKRLIRESVRHLAVLRV